MKPSPTATTDTGELSASLPRGKVVRMGRGMLGVEDRELRAVRGPGRRTKSWLLRIAQSAVVVSLG